MTPRTVGAIAIGPSSNMQGGVRFFSLNTGEIINRLKHDYTILPMPEDVIKCVNRMARKNRAGLHFSNRHNDPDVENESDLDSDESDDEDYVPPDAVQRQYYDIEHEDSSSSSDDSDTDDDDNHPMPDNDVPITGVPDTPTSNIDITGVTEPPQRRLQ